MKKKVFCIDCVYFVDGFKWYNVKCKFNPKIRVDCTFRERKEVKLYSSPSVKNKRNRCKDYEKKEERF